MCQRSSVHNSQLQICRCEQTENVINRNDAQVIGVKVIKRNERKHELVSSTIGMQFNDSSEVLKSLYNKI